jgi:prevent-host-death family protein
MVIDHGTTEEMQTMPISKFKATCLAVLERVRKTGRPLRVTRFGKPVADIVPTRAEPKRSWLGSMRGTAVITGDIVGPTDRLVDRDAIKFPERAFPTNRKRKRARRR